MKIYRKRFFALILFCMLSLSSCAPIVDAPEPELNVYATFYPIYALAEMIAKDVPGIEIHCLVQPQDECLRSYQLSDWDLYLLNYSADGVLAGGRGLEGYSGTLEALSEHAFFLSEVLYGLELCQFDNPSDGDENHFSGENPHLYLSVSGAIDILDSITATLSVIDSAHADQYETNFVYAQENLSTFQTANYVQTLVCSGRKAAILNESLIYPALECQLEIVEIIERENGEMLYDDHLNECINRLTESGAEIVLIEQQAPKMLTDMLAEAGFEVVRLNTMSTYSESDGVEGYLAALRENVAAIAEACINTSSGGLL